jgi:hypothetical protein
MKRLPIPVLLLIANLALAAGPGDYRFETGASFERRNFDDITFPGGFDPIRIEVPDADIWRVFGEYYFEQVNTEKVPLAEAAYLGRKSSVELLWTRTNIEATDLDALQLAAQVYVPNTMLFVAVGGSRADTLVRGPFGLETDQATDWFAVAGITPFDGLRISTYYGNEQGYDPNVAVKYVSKIRDSYFYGAWLQLVDPSGGDLNVNASLEFFFDLTLRARVRYDEFSDRWAASAEKFFKSRFGVGVEYYSDDFGDGFRIDGAYRL